MQLPILVSLGCIDACAAIITPFISRFGYWYKMRGRRWKLVEEGPGDRFVRKLKFTLASYRKTEIMEASFRTITRLLLFQG